MHEFLKPILCVALLSGCATPYENCVRQANAPLRETTGLISVTEGNIARGYAIHRQYVPYTVALSCESEAGVFYDCSEQRYRWDETPVAIDISEERRKLDIARQHLRDQRSDAATHAAACHAQFPEG